MRILGVVEVTPDQAGQAARAAGATAWGARHLAEMPSPTSSATTAFTD